MLHNHDRRRFLINMSLSVSSTTLAGCGSILHPERIGQPRSGPIDWKIAALDGVGLMLFFVPGVVAFAIDFYNGTIFLPSRNYGEIDAQREDELLAIEVEKNELSQENVERVVSEHTEQDVVLGPGKYHFEPLPAIEQFWGLAGRMRTALS
ncbi:hypothetical protein [Allorhodopirellula solitaria]|uniref:Uncharacterized protein n=1 Tax=Allorhodopirellula solitaria TaxID=2527987 RepID=A0A5C5YHP3_9BACT|nr:hypothetical protein [Allorhodopirellula solitaria]TWT74411.1 hypothetical protein CA85_13000 [Allorhodopirellula solitaria]